MAGPKKKKQQQKHGIDFKKIKRKIGKKLPPPKNATNTQIKFKAIILPEQSVAAEKEGSATSKKGLTLLDLLKQTSHHNSKVRRDALNGIRELIRHYPMELKTHKFDLMEKLSQRIGDDDMSVRETLYQLLKLEIFPGLKEDFGGSLVSQMMGYIFHAMTNFAVEVRLMAFKFLDLVEQNMPSSIFLVYAEKILQNYGDLLGSNLVNAQDKGALKNALLGLIRCLSLLHMQQEDDLREAVRPTMYPWSRRHPAGFSLTAKNLKGLVPLLVTRLLELLPSLCSTGSLDSRILDVGLYLLQCTNLSLKFSITESFCWEERKCRKDQKYDSIVMDQTVSPLLMKLLTKFPLSSTDGLSAKNKERSSLLDAEITEIFLNVQECQKKESQQWVRLHATITDKFLPYIEMLLVEETGDARQKSAAIREKQLLSLLPYIPKLISQHVSEDWRYHLLQAFTRAFRDCHAESELKMAYVSVIEKMLIYDSNTFLDPNVQANLDHQIEWIRALPDLLIALGDEHPSRSEVVLRLIRDLGSCAPIHSTFLLEYEGLKSRFGEFFSKCDAEGNISFGPFVRLPRECEMWTMGCLSLFKSLDRPLLTAISRLCVCNDLDPEVLFRILERLGDEKNIQIGDLLNFFICVISSMKVIRGKAVDQTLLKISSAETIQTVTEIVIAYIGRKGDPRILLRLLEGRVVRELLQKPDMDNAHAMLQVICSLDAKDSKPTEPTRLSEDSIAGLRGSFPHFMLDVVQQTPVQAEAALELVRAFYFKPCYDIFERTHKLLSLFLGDIKSLLDDLSRVGAIAELIASLHVDARMRQILFPFQTEICSILQKISHIQASEHDKMTLEESHRVRCALDRLATYRACN